MAVVIVRRPDILCPDTVALEIKAHQIAGPKYGSDTMAIRRHRGSGQAGLTGSRRFRRGTRDVLDLRFPQHAAGFSIEAIDNLVFFTGALFSIDFLWLLLRNFDTLQLILVPDKELGIGECQRCPVLIPFQ